MGLQGSKIVVVGGSSGIGLGAAAAALERGAEVVLVGRSEDRLRAASAALGGPARVKAIAADATHEDEVARMFAEVGAFDHLVVTRGVVPVAALVGAVAGSLGYLARALALELAPTRVNVVSPGWVDTPMWDAIAGQGKTAFWAEMAGRLPAGRIGTPADIALAYVFLMESEFTTGTTLHVDGGHALI